MDDLDRFTLQSGLGPICLIALGAGCAFLLIWVLSGVPIVDCLLVTMELVMPIVLKRL